MTPYLLILDRLSNRRAVLGLLAAYGLVFAAILISLGQLMALTGGTGILDFEQGYDADRVAEVFASYGTEGFRLVRRIALLDLVNPALYGLLMGLAIRAVLRPGPGWPAALPLLAALLDYAENVTIGMMIRSHPTLPEGLVRISSALSLIKTAALAMAILALIGAALVRLRRRRG